MALRDGRPARLILADSPVGAPGAPKPDQMQMTQPPPARAIADGRVVYRKCQACHSLEAGRTLIGPSLAGVVGRHAGSVPNFPYSPAMKQANIVWSEQTLDAYLTDPQKAVPGNRMPFPGLNSATDRFDVIAFLRSQSPDAAAPVSAAAASPPPPAPASPPAAPPTACTG